MRTRAPKRKKPTGLRGLGSGHQMQRRRVSHLVATGEVRCSIGAECFWAEEVDGVLVGGFVSPLEPWDLDHTDDRRGYRGVAHAKCNRSAGARKRNAKTRRSRAW